MGFEALKLGLATGTEKKNEIIRNTFYTLLHIGLRKTSDEW